jgi:hypothetical protein
MNLSRLFLGVFLVIGLLASFGLSVKSANSQELRPAILNVKYESIESLGLYDSPKDGSLGRDLWDNSRRSEIQYLLERMPAPGSSPVHRQLVMATLLTEASANLIENDVPPEPGKDLLTLRLEKLIEFGAYKQAFELYSSLNREPYAPELARAGILAMMFNGEKSLACLEYKTVQDRDFSGSFWADMALYCHYAVNEDGAARADLSKAKLPVLRSIAKNKDFRVSYSASLDKMTDTELAILAAEDRIAWPKPGQGVLSSMPGRYLGILATLDDLQSDEKFYVLTRGVQLGIVDDGALAAFYKEVYDADLRQLENPQGLGWREIPYALHESQVSRYNTEQKWGAVSRGFSQYGTYGAAAFAPFASVIDILDISILSPADLKKAVDIILFTGNPIPGKWTKFLATIKPANEFEGKLRSLSNILSTFSIDPALRDQETKDFLKKYNKKSQKTLSIVIENIDSTNNTPHNALEIYDKHFDLTSADNYVMPSPSVWDRLLSSSQNGRIGEAVLLSTIVLQKFDLGSAYPAYAYEVLRSLNTVGLTNVSRALIYEHVLDQKL